MATEFLTKIQVEAFLSTIQNGQIFSIIYRKKDGSLRRAVGKRGVISELKGGDPKYNGVAGDAENISYYDHEIAQYRCFNANRVVRIKGGGAWIQAGDGIDETVVDAHGEEVK